jgi:ankyrin repeat protein
MKLLRVPFVAAVAFVAANSLHPADQSGLNAALHAALNDNAIDAFQAALAAGAEVDAVDEHGSPPLHAAVEFKRVPLVAALLAAGAQVDARDADQATALHVAVGWGWTDIVELLLAHHANVDARDKDGATPLFRLGDSKRAEIGDLLLAAGCDVNAANHEGVTALHSAAGQGYVEATTWLLAHQADPARKDAKGYTPVDLAIAAGNYAAARVLLAREGGKANVTAIDQPGLDGRAALHNAVINGETDSVTFLVDTGAKVDVRDGEGATPLCYAAAMGQADIMTFLLDHGADVNATLKTGQTAVDVAKARQQDAVLAILESRGGKDGRTFILSTLSDAFQAGDAAKVGQLMQAFPELAKFNDLLTTAADISNAAVIKTLLANGCPVDLANAEGLTALQVAVLKKRTANVRMLLAHQPNIKVRDPDGYTVLHYLIARADAAAATAENLDAFLAGAQELETQQDEIAGMLIEAGADLNARAADGTTPLDLAMEEGAFAMADLLRSKQAQGRPSSSEIFQATRLGYMDRLKKLLAADRGLADFRDELGRTPVVYAADYGSLDAVKVLLEARADINAANTKGETALHLAARKGDRTTVEFLVGKKAAINARTKTGQTPLDYASEARTNLVGQSIETERTLAAKRQVAEFLRKKGAKRHAHLGPIPAP